jgi:hypothetical protein
MRDASDILLFYARTRDLRDRIRDARDACMCERHEGWRVVDGVPEMNSGEPCWKAARKWDDEVAWNGEPTGRRRFYFDPPIDAWCATCRNRQAYTEQLRAAVRDHAAAKRAILQRGRALARRSDATRDARPAANGDRSTQ